MMSINIYIFYHIWIHISSCWRNNFAYADWTIICYTSMPQITAHFWDKQFFCLRIFWCALINISSTLKSHSYEWKYDWSIYNELIIYAINVKLYEAFCSFGVYSQPKTVWNIVTSNCQPVVWNITLFLLLLNQIQIISCTSLTAKVDTPYKQRRFLQQGLSKSICKDLFENIFL